MLLKRGVGLFCLLVAFVILTGVPAPAQTIVDRDDDTTLRQIIVYGRHSVRSTITPEALLNLVAVDAYPQFNVPLGYLTPHGRKAENLLGDYFRQYLLNEGLMTGNDDVDLARSYFRANCIQRSNITAQAFQLGLIPGSKPAVHSYPLDQSDPVFDPLSAGVVEVNVQRALAEVRSLYGNGASLASAYSGELALIRSALFDYPLGTNPPPPTPEGKIDPTALKFSLTASSPPYHTGAVIDLGGLFATTDAMDPFIMQYADGFPFDQVAWGRMTVDQISQHTRLTSLVFDIELRTPYLNRIQGSNAASHVLRTMEQAIIGDTIPGSFGDPDDRMVVVISSDDYVATLAGLLNLHWQLPGYQPDLCAPGGALVFELRQHKRTQGYLVRVYYTAQTLGQLRNLTPLSPDNPPATKQLLVPGGSRSASSMDVEFTVFQRLVQNAIDPNAVQDPLQEVPPTVLHGVPLK